MKKNDLSAKFNGHLTTALAEGFAPCMTELRGSYSGVLGTQLVLAKGNERIVMWMEENKDYRHDAAPDTVHMFVSRFALAKGESTEFHYMWPSDWKEHLVDEMVAYEVSDRRDGWYVDDADEAARAKETRRSRYPHHYGSERLREYAVDDRLLGIARRLKGFKTVKRDNLRVYKLRKTWHFENKVSRHEVCLGY